MKKLLGSVAALSLVFVALAPADAADRNLAPAKTISGASSEIQWIGRVGVGPDGTVTGSSAYWGALFTYAPTAGANATWSRRITGGKTGLAEPTPVAVDAQGRVWTSLNGMTPYSVGLFAANANGNAAPVKTIGGANSGLSQATGIAVGPNGDLFVLDAASDSIRVFDAQAGGNAEPKRVISGANTLIDQPNDLAVDAAGTAYVAEPSAGTVLAFAPGAQGNVAPARFLSGPATTLAAPAYLAVDSGRNLYVSDTSAGAVAVFAPTAVGNVAPATRLYGAATLLGGAGAVAVGADRRVYVHDGLNQAIRVYAALVPLQRPGVVRSLTVSGTRSGPRRVVSWAAPVSNLNTPAVTAYKIVVKKRARTVLSTTTTAVKRSVVLLRSKLRSGTFTVSVVAVNKQGAGPAKTVTFTVR